MLSVDAEAGRISIEQTQRWSMRPAEGRSFDASVRRARTVLHELASRHAETLLAELRDADGRGLPGHVDRELATYLRCGLPDTKTLLATSIHLS